MKYLGLDIDDTLKFYSQADHVKSKLSQLTGVAYRLSKRLSMHAARKYYYSCVYSLVTYCISTWGGVIKNSYRGKLLKNAHDKIIRVLFGKFYGSENIFKSAKLLNIMDIQKYYTCIHMYKLLKMQRNEHVAKLVKIEMPTHGDPTSSGSRLILPFPRVESIKFNFEYQFINNWNSIPLEIAESSSLRVFKKRLFNYFVGKY